MTDTAREQNEKQLSLHLSNAKELPYLPEDKWVIFSDLHMGNGSRRDDYVHNSDLFHKVLGKYYLPGNFKLILNGDVEDLHKFTWKQVYSSWKPTYALFDSFASEDRLLKTVGNHDSRLLLDLRESYPYQMDTVLRMTGLDYPILFYHGHQISAFYEKFNDISRIGLRYLAMPLGIMNFSVAHDSRKRHYLEKRIYRYSLREQIISIIGHTHRPLFESLTKAETLRYRIEYLLTQYRNASEKERQEIESEVALLKAELGDWRSRKGRSDLQSGLYAEDEVPVPCMFNSGTVLGKRGITCLEISKGNIRLIHWLENSEASSGLHSNDGRIISLSGGSVRRRKLRRASLAYIMDSVRLLS